MANVMTTYVTVTNLDETSFVKLKEIISNSDGGTLDSEQAVKPLFEDFNMDRGWMEDNIGSKWITVDFLDNYYSGEVQFIIESAWSVPTGYLEKLSEVICSFKEDVVLYGTYQDESYDPSGAFIFAKDYVDIEDYEKEIDEDKIFEDDDYRDNIQIELNDIKKQLLESYLDYLQD